MKKKRNKRRFSWAGFVIGVGLVACVSLITAYGRYQVAKECRDHSWFAFDGEVFVCQKAGRSARATQSTYKGRSGLM